MKKILLCILSIFIIFLLYLLYPAPQNINDPIDSAIYLSIGKNIQNVCKATTSTKSVTRTNCCAE